MSKIILVGCLVFAVDLSAASVTAAVTFNKDVAPIVYKNCAACHKWDRQTLCEQGASYAKNPRYALRISHPYGGFSSALMQWAKSGCQ